MFRFISRRLLWAIPVLIIGSFIMFMALLLTDRPGRGGTPPQRLA